MEETEETEERSELERLEDYYEAQGNKLPLLAALMDQMLGFKGNPRD
tara:strand:- start:206 stop:346 length:141 start_codon:yes stop_codon:yes gene_type:complete